MSYHQNKFRKRLLCWECGYSLLEGWGADRIRYFPLLEGFMCGECATRIQHDNLKKAVEGEPFKQLDMFE